MGRDLTLPLQRVGVGPLLPSHKRPNTRADQAGSCCLSSPPHPMGTTQFSRASSCQVYVKMRCLLLGYLGVDPSGPRGSTGEVERRIRKPCRTRLSGHNYSTGSHIRPRDVGRSPRSSLFCTHRAHGLQGVPFHAFPPPGPRLAVRLATPRHDTVWPYHGQPAGNRTGNLWQAKRHNRSRYCCRVAEARSKTELLGLRQLSNTVRVKSVKTKRKSYPTNIGEEGPDQK